jgi:hypothetical protein
MTRLAYGSIKSLARRYTSLITSRVPAKGLIIMRTSSTNVSSINIATSATVFLTTLKQENWEQAKVGDKCFQDFLMSLSSLPPSPPQKMEYPRLVVLWASAGSTKS